MAKMLPVVIAIIVSGINIPYSIVNPSISISPGSLSFLPIDNDTITTSQYGPFQVGSNDFDLNINYKIYTSSSKVIERIRVLNYDGTSVLSASSKPSHNYISGTSYSVSFRVPMSDYWTNNGLTFKFEILDASTRTVIKNYSTSIVPPLNSYINASILKSGVYKTKGLGFKGEEIQFKTIIEEYDFTNITNYMYADYYYRLPFEEASFTYNSDFLFTFDGAYLSFIDNYMLFPYLQHDEDGVIDLPLTFIRSGNRMIPRLKNMLYVNKKTLQLSDTYRSGFVQTTDFYLPINGRQLFDGSRLYFDFISIGANRISTSFSLSYDASKTYVGLCGDSEYCVSGGIKQ